MHRADKGVVSVGGRGHSLPVVVRFRMTVVLLVLPILVTFQIPLRHSEIGE